MSHPRTAIRDALVDRLKTKVDDVFLTDAKDKIYGSRSKPLFDQFLPAILVYARNENILEGRFTTDGFGTTKRELDVAIEVFAFDVLVKHHSQVQQRRNYW